MGRVFDELKRRNVFRVAVAYVVASWLVLQVADIVLQGIEAPAWVMKVFMLMLGLGFPIVLLFSWAYELTPEGLRREEDVDRSQSITPETGRKLNIITIGMLVAAMAVVGIDRSFLHADHGPAATSPTTSATNDKSIAVLAFEDLSPEGDQEYFADGLSEELLNVLAKVGDLQVAGRTSSFAFKGQNTDLREIGELLNVAHILEGSVRKSGNRIRVTAQLIKADDGFHLFSETYDRELEDIFAVQDEIAQKISDALLSEIIGTEAPEIAETDPEAYELYLKARQRIHTRDIFNLREANRMLDRALEIDPIYAPALAQQALVTYLMSDALGAYGSIPLAEAMPVVQRNVEQALALDDGLAEAHAMKGLLLDAAERYDEAIPLLEHARRLNPTMSDAGNWLSSSYATVGRRGDAIAVLEEVVKRDPTYGPAFNNLIVSYSRTSRFDAADALISRVERIMGDNDQVDMARGIVDVMRGSVADAARYLQRGLQRNPDSSVNKAWYGFALLGLADFETLARVGLSEHRILAYAEQDYMEQALQELESLDLTITFPPRVVNEVGAALINHGEVDAYLRFIAANFGSAEKLLARYPVSMSWGTEYLAPAAWAYREVGQDDVADMLIAASARAVEEFGDDVQGNWVYTLAIARHAALTGDDETALAALRRSVDSGMRIIFELEAPFYDHLRKDQRFQAIHADLLEIVDAERAKAGLPPHRPIDTRDGRPSFVN